MLCVSSALVIQALLLHLIHPKMNHCNIFFLATILKPIPLYQETQQFLCTLRFIKFSENKRKKRWRLDKACEGKANRFEAGLTVQQHTTSQWELFCWRAGWAGEVDQCASEPPPPRAPAHLVSAVSSHTTQHKTPSTTTTLIGQTHFSQEFIGNK